jgi:hypothetical protein
MKLSKGFNPVVRAVGVFSAVAIIAGGVTYAALNTSATLSGNTITTADANLLLWDGDSYETTAPGFDVTGLIPGEGSADQKFYVKNAGDTNLNVTAHVATAPVAPAEGYGFDGWQNLRVTFKAYNPACTTASDRIVHTTMADLLAGQVALPCNNLKMGAQGDSSPGAVNTEGNYSVSFDITPASVSGTPKVGDFDLVFTGAATSETTPSSI